MRLALPILIPLLTAAVGLVGWRSRTFQRRAGLAGSLLLLAAAVELLATVRRDGIQVLRIAGWPAYFGVALTADLLSAVMVVIAGVLAVAISVYSLADIDARREAYGFHPLYHVLLMGVCGAFLTGDIFNLYVWFEVMLIASFVLLALGGSRGEIEGALKYVTLNLVASSIFLAAVGLIYSAFGALNLASLAGRMRAPETPEGVPGVLAMLLLVAFGSKAAIFPLFFWLPASYHTPPPAVAAIFAGLLTKVGVYALIRVFTLLFTEDFELLQPLALFLAGATMLTGVLGAMVQTETRRILAFHSVSQVGYMLMGLALFTPAALAGALLFMIHHAVVKSNLFLISGIARRLGGSFELGRLGGLYLLHPALAALFFVTAFSLAGFPPFSGFVAKLALVRAGLDVGSYGIVAVSLAVSLLTLVSMTKIWSEAYWRPPPEDAPRGASRASLRLWAPVTALAVVTLAVGVGVESVYALCLEAAGQLLDPGAYVRAVLGGGA